VACPSPYVPVSYENGASLGNAVVDLDQRDTVRIKQSVEAEHAISLQSRTSPMSEMGIRHFDGLPMTSGLPPDADVVTAGRHVSNVLNPDMARKLRKEKAARRRLSIQT